MATNKSICVEAPIKKAENGAENNATTDARPILREPIKTAIQTGNTTASTCGNKNKNKPTVVATPLPPVKFKKTERVLPSNNAPAAKKIIFSEEPSQLKNHNAPKDLKQSIRKMRKK